MQRWYSRIAGYRRLACTGTRSRPTFDLKQHRNGHSQYFSSCSAQRARKGASATRRLSPSRAVEESEDHPAYLPAWKLPPTKDRQHAGAWIHILNSILPPRLRSAPAVADVSGEEAAKDDGSSSTNEHVKLTPRDVALILRRAQRSYGLDILTHLGVEKGQWKAVAWLVTRIVDSLWTGNLHVANTSIHSKLPGPWKSRASLDQITGSKSGAGLHLPGNLAPQSLRSLDELTLEASPLYEPLEATVTHEMLGTVWRSLGNMIIADAARLDRPGSNITPEILEIIASLHHSGMMPSSIYSYYESDDLSALRQPPTLHLLSSHILTSLTDAAWRAHESLVVEEAKSKGGEYLQLRPELPGSMYKVHVAGLGHEVWLELVLWSCLHGNWIEDGASILQNVARTSSWSALSWRELAVPFIEPGKGKSINWDDLRYRLNAGHAYGDPNLTQATKDKVKRTLSTEVIAAFVEALLNLIRTSVGARGTPAAQVLQYINQLKSFLDKHKLSLGSTSWDAVVLRVFDSQGVDIHKEPALAERIVRLLSSEFGAELSATNAPARNEQWQPLPSYVLDGTAITMGLMHRVLRAYIEIGNLGGALRTFEELQRMTDRNKQKSIQDFFERQARAQAPEAVSEPTKSDDGDHAITFSSHLTGIEYPAFYPQLPTTILAPFLDLLTETRSVSFGQWLLNSPDIDGPIISPNLYADPLVGPALVRFASSTEDADLLIKLLEAQGLVNSSSANLPQSSLLALLQGQVRLRKWDTVDNILSSLADSPSYPLEGQSVAVLCAAVLRDIDSTRGPSWDRTRNPDLDRAFRTLLRVASDAASLNSDLNYRVRTALMVLGCIDKKWEELIWTLTKHTAGSQRFTMTSRAFNTILEAVVSTYGSETGKVFLGRFWRAAVDESIAVPAPVTAKEELEAGVHRMSAERPGAFADSSPLDINIEFGRHAKGMKKARLHGLFVPNIITIDVVLRKALR